MLLLACLRGWKSMVILEPSLVILYSPIICSGIVFGSPNPVFIGIALIIVSSLVLYSNLQTTSKVLHTPGDGKSQSNDCSFR